MKKLVVLVCGIVMACASVFAQANLIEDPSFESKNIDTWTLEGNRANFYVEQKKDNAKSGICSYKYWAEKGDVATLSKTIDLANGNYTLKMWAMGGGGDNEIKLFAKDFGGAEVTAEVVNKGWKKWEQYSVTFDVKNGQVTVGILVDAGKKCWGNFDDLELVRNF